MFFSLFIKLECREHILVVSISVGSLIGESFQFRVIFSFFGENLIVIDLI
jgi:hypothetical protein